MGCARWLAATAGLCPRQGESQAAWEAFLWDLHERGLRGRQLQLVHQRRLSGTGGGDRDHLSARASPALLGAQDAQPARRRAPPRPSRSEARCPAHLPGARTPRRRAEPSSAFAFTGRALYPALVRRLERDLPELLAFFDFPQPLWRKLRTTNAIERCFVEVRRRTRPMVLFVNVASVERIIYAIFQQFQPALAKPHPHPFYTSSLTSPRNAVRRSGYDTRI